MNASNKTPGPVADAAFDPRLGLSKLRSEFEHHKKFFVGARVQLTHPLKFDSIAFPIGHAFDVEATRSSGVDLKDDQGSVLLNLDRKFLEVLPDPVQACENKPKKATKAASKPRAQKQKSP